MYVIPLQDSTWRGAKAKLDSLGISTRDEFASEVGSEWFAVVNGEHYWFFHSYGSNTIEVKDRYDWSIYDAEIHLVRLYLNQLMEESKATSVREWFAKTSEAADFLSSLNFPVSGYIRSRPYPVQNWPY